VDVGQLKRDRTRTLILKALTELEDGSVIAAKDLEIHIPKRFVENGMASVSDVVSSVCAMGVVIPKEGVYSPLIALSDAILVPLSIRETNIQGNQYLVLEFSKGDTVIQSLNYIMDPNKPYAFTMEFYYYAKIPWYMDHRDVRSLFDNAKAECGETVGSSFQVPRVLTSLMFRDPDNLDQAYRYSPAAKEGRPPVIVGLNNGSMLIDGTFAKITGGYLQDNTLGAMVNPDTKVTDYERIMRGIPQ